MQLSNQFETPRAPDDTFALLLDAPSIVHCVPGAELTSSSLTLGGQRNVSATCVLPGNTPFGIAMSNEPDFR